MKNIYAILCRGIYLLLPVAIIFYSCTSTKQETRSITLSQTLDSIIKPYKATIGIAIIHIENGDTLSINNEHHYPMQSVYKFPLAIAVLHEVDNGKFSLDQKIHIAHGDLHKNTWSPLRDSFPEGNIDIPISELLRYTVSLSDNNACDILFRIVGGTGEVEKYIQSIGFQEMKFAATEQEMHGPWEIQFTNWTKPMEMAKLLEGFYQGKYLSDSSNAFLMHLMLESSNSVRRIKGLLPEETIVAHKTGSSSTNADSITAAINDVGIVTLPDGSHFAIAVFVSDSKETAEINEQVIAEISKTVFDYFNAGAASKF
ncbi:MAG: class A beta-lactamase, subclass A2 [Chitinophagales bacterium]